VAESAATRNGREDACSMLASLPLAQRPNHWTTAHGEVFAVTHEARRPPLVTFTATGQGECGHTSSAKPPFHTDLRFIGRP
jgi:hypothetical protein